MKVEVEREQDGRWLAEVPVVSGAMAYGATRDEAVSKSRPSSSASLPTA